MSTLPTTYILSDLQPFQCLLEYCVANSLIVITEEEIEALSSKNIIGQLVTTMQILYFIAGCIGRRIQGLPITELESLTLGFAALNLVSYSFWWSKPLRVRFPVRVTDKTIPRPAKPVKENSSLIAWISETYQAFDGRIREDYYVNEDDPSNPKPLSLCFCLFVLPTLVLLRLFNSAASGDTDDGGPPDNGNLFSASTFEERKSPLTLTLVYTAAIAFGVFHCIPIMLDYRDLPGHKIDHDVWTVFALMMTVLPLVFGILHFSLRSDLPLGLPLFILISFFSISYGAARIALMVLAAKQLTDLSPSALQNVEWANLIPHFGI